MTIRNQFLLTSIIILCISFKSHLVIADIFSVTNKNIRIEVIDYRDFPEDVIFWIHQAKDIPVIAQKLINNEMYPISITMYNDSNKSIKLIKNAIGGLSLVEGHEVAQLYHHTIFERIIKKVSCNAVMSLIVIEMLATTSALLENVLEEQIKKMKYALAGGFGFFAGVKHWQEATAINTLISQVFISQLLPEEIILESGCSMSCLLFARHSPAGYTLKIPIFDQQDNQIVSFLCPFDI